jgi:hypothetical protein
MKTVTEDVWSPIIWTDGLRLKTHFGSSEYVALDYDSGKPTVAEMKAELDHLGLSYILATTKSHGLEKRTAAGKVSPACDRFRVILKAEEPQLSRELYEYNMGRFVEFFPGADPSCVDAARFFFPCKEVVAFKFGGKRVAWAPFGEDYETEEQRYERRKERAKERSAMGLIPQWIHDILGGRIETPDGGLHKEVYRIAANLAEHGWDAERIETAILKTNLKHIGEHDVRRAVANGIASAE